MKRAMFVKRIDIGAGDALLYKLSDPVEFMQGGQPIKTATVVVSAVTSPIGNQKFAQIFPSNENGEILSWEAMPGSQKGTLDHEAALESAGYEVM